MSTLETQLIDIINGQAQGEGSQNGEDTDRYSRKVFVGGLPVKSAIIACHCKIYLSQTLTRMKFKLRSESMVL